ncbi:MAG: EVE domain-containing protein [Alphaproteobacteria bacterium]|nr:EVE domain-containing protein [Alphaproteobacteria bacterium]
MNYWLVKTEPETWSWDDQVKHGRTDWDGVRNHQAANNLKAMKKGDLVLFYHSGDEKRIVGLVKVGREHQPDPSDPTGKFVMVEMLTAGPVETPLSLAEIKADKRLQHLMLVRHSRLSVMPIDQKAWEIICEKTGLAP